MSVPSKFQKLAAQGFGFAEFPDVRIFKRPGKGSKQHLLFGDYITPPKNENGTFKRWSSKLLQELDGKWWVQVRSRQEEGWVKLDNIRLDRIMEVNFVDIGQGDGCHLVTPDDCHFIIDAGKGDNMYRFLRWRFNLNNPGRKLPKFYGLISHPDDDHWGGFELLLSKLPKEQKRLINFEKLFHNGIVQRTNSKLGATKNVGGEDYLVDFLQTRADVKKILNKKGDKSEYESFLIGALKNYPGLKIETVWKEVNKKKVLYRDRKLTLEVLAPVPELVNNQLCLRWLDSKLDEIGKTKNGHSVVLMAHIGKMKVMLGGDLNSKSADYLMEQYSGANIRLLRSHIERANGEASPDLKKQMREAITSCQAVFQAEVAKSCHHGSHDITNEFLQAVNPMVTVISSGDEEPHCHPRPETLGAIGKFSRGERPLIYCTELARSSPEFAKLEARSNKTDKTKQRLVSTYGMITLRTDGENAIVAQKLERKRNSFGLITKWHIDKLVWNSKKGEFITRV